MLPIETTDIICSLQLIRMGNSPLCGADTRDFGHSQYIMCGQEPEYRNSTTINIVNHVPVITGQPLNFQKQQTFRKVEKSASEFCTTNGLQNSFIPIVARIIAYGHTNIFAAYRRLPESRKYEFLDEIRFVDIDFIDLLYHRYILGQNKPKVIVSPPQNLVNTEDFSYAQRGLYSEQGQELLTKKQVGFLFLCAGSSSRFLFQDKFLLPLELVSGRTLLELMLIRLRKNLKAHENSTLSVPIIFACNPNNRGNIQNYLKSKDYFGFDVSKVRFLTVPMMPIMDMNGKICITFEFKILQRPCGSLKCVEELLGSGIFQFLKTDGIEFLHIVGTENLAENPGDPFMLGYLKQHNLDIAGKCTEPLYDVEELPRYATAKNGKTYLVGIQDILQNKIKGSQSQNIATMCPVAVNSVVCRLGKLRTMVKDYENSMFLTQEYRPIKSAENYYDFERQRPAVNQPVMKFEKDLGYLFTCTKQNALLKVHRNEYIPILERSGTYSMREACKAFSS